MYPRRVKTRLPKTTKPVLKSFFLSSSSSLTRSSSLSNGSISFSKPTRRCKKTYSYYCNLNLLMSFAISETIVVLFSSEVGTTAVVGRPFSFLESLPTKNLAEALELLELEWASVIRVSTSSPKTKALSSTLHQAISSL